MSSSLQKLVLALSAPGEPNASAPAPLSEPAAPAKAFTGNEPAVIGQIGLDAPSTIGAPPRPLAFTGGRRGADSIHTPDPAKAAEELAWVLAARAGDTAAFGKLAQAYQRQCVAVALRLLGNAHDAAELVQDALVKAFRSLPQLQQSERFGPWLMRIVTNLALNFRRSRGRRQALSIEQASGGDGAENIKSTLAGSILDAPDQPMQSDELGSAIQNALDGLPEKQRLALVMFAIEKMPQKEVADVLECSVEAVKWYVFTARKQLRKDLERFF
jgi:RNA polymerase sigma-70 factor (ECF subfamily)